MNTTSNASTPVEIKKLTRFYIALRFDKWFITDNRTIFLAPKNGFCPQCFMRRYLTEYDGQDVTKISAQALQLAEIIDKSAQAASFWSSYSVETGQKIKDFSLVSYESCQACAPGASSSEEHAKRSYENLLKDDAVLDISAVKEQLFSFGFARAFYTQNKDGIENPYFRQILGEHFFSRINAVHLAPNAPPAELVTLGYSRDRGLSEIKAIMEYLERYAFLERTNPLHTKEVDEALISSFLSLYSAEITPQELAAIRSDAVWGINLLSREVRAVPLRFIYDMGDLSFIRPTSSGFAAHEKISSAMTASIIELVERDAFVRFWHDPERAYQFSPEEDVSQELDEVLSVLQILLNNKNQLASWFVIQSPTQLPVVMATISSSDFSCPPSLIFGYGAGLTLRQAVLKSLDELKTNALNVLTCMSGDQKYLSRQFDSKITAIPDRMNFYATHRPRARLGFLDMVNPLRDGIFEEVEQQTLEGVVERFAGHGLEIYGIDATPRCFADKNAFVTRAFSPDLYPLQFESEHAFNLPVGNLSVKEEFPHCFI